MLLKRSLFILLLGTFASHVFAQQTGLPHKKLSKDSRGNLNFKIGDKTYLEVNSTPDYTLKKMQGNPQGRNEGILLDFGTDYKGKKPALVYYGFIPYDEVKYPQPIYYKRSVSIEKGKALLSITSLKGKYDFIDWETTGKGTLGYRVVNESGMMLYDGIVSFTGKGPFTVVPTIIEGPFVNCVTPTDVTISLTLSSPTNVSVEARSKNLMVSSSSGKGTSHEVHLTGLAPGTEYDYDVSYGAFKQSYHFRTAPKKGSKKPFTFAYVSDSRNGKGGGERNLYGANFYIMKKIMMHCSMNNIAFMQFSGDLVNGYLDQPGEIDLQYANWKRAIEPYWHYTPMYISMGNHEALSRLFRVDGDTDLSDYKNTISIDRFPYNKESAEAVFARNFVNPQNGPSGEDGASYDPDPEATNFPSYNENVFHYTYDNVAVVVLNSNYWYAPHTRKIPDTDGGLHGYIMDQQLAWFDSTLEVLEADKKIDHIFVTQHTPCFPNGGHVSDDMWYAGDNSFRPYVNGKPLEKGIIERRDQILNLTINKSKKVVAFLTGDEHNYAKTKIGPTTPIYPENWDKDKLILTRTIYQINNGAAGAPYYAQEKTPWSGFVSGFTSQNAVVFFDVKGKKINVRVVNPDTGEKIESYKLR